MWLLLQKSQVLPGVPGKRERSDLGCSMITFGNGITFSHNFDRTGKESRETSSLKFAFRSDVPFCVANLLG